MASKKQNATKRESGQATLEGALALPVFFLIVFFISQVAWVLFSASTLNFAVSQTQWSFTKEQVAASTDDNELVRQAILERSPGIFEANLTVENAAVELEAPVTRTRVTTSADDQAHGIERIITSQQTMTVEADVVYEIPTLMPFEGLNELEYKVHIDKNKILYTQFEVS